jgi:hypothetical protein
LLAILVVGHIWDITGEVTFKGSCVRPTPISGVLELVWAEVVPPTQEPDCGAASPKTLRVAWNGGVTLEGGAHVPADYAAKYSVTLQDGTTITPSRLGDVDDADNNHLLCFTEADARGWTDDNLPEQVAFPAGYFTDPNEDGTNLAASVAVTFATTEPRLPRLSAQDVSRTRTIQIMMALLLLLAASLLGCVAFARNCVEGAGDK